MDGSNAEEFAGDVKEALDCFCHEFTDHVPGDVTRRSAERQESPVSNTFDVQLPGCNTAECPSICECTLEQCALPAINCQLAYVETVCEMNPEFFTTDSIACASCEFIDRVVVETLAFFALPD